MSDTALIVDDYTIHMLERIREARLEFKAYMHDLSGIDDPAPDEVPDSFFPAEVLEGQTVIAETSEMIVGIYALEGELIRHIERLLTMPEVTPLRQLDWHLHLSSSDMKELQDLMAAHQPVPASDPHLIDEDYVFETYEDSYEEVGGGFRFGYPPALFIEALYWAQRAAHQS